ncbi:hypothetical protein ACFWGM_02275 [Streptomyces roseolus]|uniref:hypothetical protein n=1 Tax=Streptomyces roseolus TaxID=67358 RepID=UPI00362E0A95
MPGGPTAALGPALPDSVLRALLGRPRARLPAPLAEPAATTEPGHRLNVTPAAVSRRLSVLATAHLVDRTP